MLDERRSFVDFAQSAQRFYESLTDMISVVELWEQLTYIADFSEIDSELILEYIYEDGPLKVTMGLPFIIAFNNTLSGRIQVYHIQRPSFRRPR